MRIVLDQSNVSVNRLNRGTSMRRDLAHSVEHSLERFAGEAIEENELHQRHRGFAAEMNAHLLEHYPRASIEWESRDAGADRRKCDALDLALRRTQERIARRGA